MLTAMPSQVSQLLMDADRALLTIVQPQVALAIHSPSSDAPRSGARFAARGRADVEASTSLATVPGARPWGAARKDLGETFIGAGPADPIPMDSRRVEGPFEAIGDLSPIAVSGPRIAVGFLGLAIPVLEGCEVYELAGAVALLKVQNRYGAFVLGASLAEGECAIGVVDLQSPWFRAALAAWRRAPLATVERVDVD
jgi:hypothetical protein